MNVNPHALTIANSIAAFNGFVTLAPKADATAKTNPGPKLYVDTTGCEYWPTCRVAITSENVVTISLTYVSG